MALQLDHVVIAASTLEAGVGFVARHFGVAAQAGGQHVRMGTHNCLVGLGDGRYLEIIAIDPTLPAPLRPRWFALDDAAMQQRLAKGPRLVHWVARSDAIAADATDSPVPLGTIHPMERGDFRWRITIPDDGHLPADGVVPTLIQWDVDAHPTQRLSDSRCRLVSLLGWHAALRDTRKYSPDVCIGPPVAGGDAGLQAVFETPAGRLTLGS